MGTGTVEAPAAPGPNDQLWVEVVDRLYSDPDLPTQVWLRVIAELPSFRKLDAETLDAHAVRQMTGHAIRSQSGPSDDQRDYMTSVGEVRARQGVDSADLMQVFRIFHDEFFKRARQILPDGPPREPIMLRLLELVLEWTGAGMAAMGEGYRRIDQQRRRSFDVQERGLVRRVLFGLASPRESAKDLERYRFHQARTFYALHARTTDSVDVRELERFLQTAGGRTPRNGLISIIDGDVCGFTCALPPGDPPVPIGVAPAKTLADLPRAFRRASRAHATALHVGHTGYVDLDDCGLYPVVLAEGDIGDQLVDRYVTPLLNLGDSGQAILETVREYIAADAKLQITADTLFVHPHTVRYRLDRFESETGCSLRSIAGLAEVWWALARHRLMSNP